MCQCANSALVVSRDARLDPTSTSLLESSEDEACLSQDRGFRNKVMENTTHHPQHLSWINGLLSIWVLLCNLRGNNYDHIMRSMEMRFGLENAARTSCFNTDINRKAFIERKKNVRLLNPKIALSCQKSV